jgi:transcriptional regulator of heat shock response
MSLAFYASPIDFNNNSDLEKKLNVEKSKINKNMITEMKTSLESSPTNIMEIHKNLKEDNDTELDNFYKKELPIKAEPVIKTQDYMLMNESIPVQKSTNSEMLHKLNNIIELFEDQKEIKTGQKNEEIILYCFLGVFVIYIMDSFVSIGKYSR